MDAADLFHVGVVVADLDAELERLGSLFGYRWSDEVALTTTVRFPSGGREVDLRFRYSRNGPRLEVIQQRPGTLWMPVEGSGLHHLGYWSDDVAADGAALREAGYAVEAEGVDGGSPTWAYFGDGHHPRIELVSTSMRRFMQQLFGDS
jgi:hypothetical protein